MQDFIVSFMNRYGYIGIFFLITIENLFPPIPSEVILTLGGFMTTYTSLKLPGVILFSTLGSLLGAIILYEAGRILGKEKLLRLASGKLGKALNLNVDDIQNSIDRFGIKGTKAVFFCRFIPILRSLISIPAGICQMRAIPFLFYTTVGSFLWNAVLIYVGSLLGEAWPIVSKILKEYSQLTRVALVLTCLFLLYKHFRKKRKDK